MPPNTARQYSVGDLVFAKIKGYPPWPARIEENFPAGYKPTPGRYPVFFFGTYELAVVSVKDLFPYEQYKFKLGIVRKMKNFNEGLKEIETHPYLSMDSDEIERLREQRKALKTSNIDDDSENSDCSFEKSEQGSDESENSPSNSSDSSNSDNSDSSSFKNSNGKSRKKIGRKEKKNLSSFSANKGKTQKFKIRNESSESEQTSSSNGNSKKKRKKTTNKKVSDQERVKDDKKVNENFKKRKNEKKLLKSLSEQSNDDDDRAPQSKKKKPNDFLVSSSDDYEEEHKLKVKVSSNNDDDESSDSLKISKFHKNLKRIKNIDEDENDDNRQNDLSKRTLKNNSVISSSASPSSSNDLESVLKLKLQEDEKLAQKLKQKELEKERRKQEKMEQKRLERLKKAQRHNSQSTTTQEEAKNQKVIDDEPINQILTSINQNIKLSLSKNNANIEKCLAAMDVVDQVKITKNNKLATFSNELKELIQTLKKCRKYKPDERVRLKAEQYLSQLKEFCVIGSEFHEGKSNSQINTTTTTIVAVSPLLKQKDQNSAMELEQTTNEEDSKISVTNE